MGRELIGGQGADRWAGCAPDYRALMVSGRAPCLPADPNTEEPASWSLRQRFITTIYIYIYSLRGYPELCSD